MYAIPQSHVVDVEGRNDDNNGGNSSGSLQFFGLQLPACFIKQPAHIPSVGQHDNSRLSLEFVLLDGCYAPMLGHAHGTCLLGGGNNAVDLVCGEFHEYTSGNFKAMKIPSKKLVCVNQHVQAMYTEAWMVGHVLEDYTCLSFGRYFYVVEFGYSYDHQIIFVGEFESLCDIEEPLLISDTL